MQSLGPALDEFVEQTGCQVEESNSPEDIQGIARKAIETGVDRLVVAGGDGTISQTVNAIAPDFSAIELALLPLGTGNDFARSLGVHDFERACAVAAGERVEPIDVVRLSGNSPSYFINSANGGFGGQVAIDVQKADKERWGAFAYWLTAINESIQTDEYTVEIEIDRQVHSYSLYGLTVANGRYAGGGFAIAPEAKLNDGRLQLTMIPVLPPLELIAAGASFAMGVSNAEGVRTLSAQEMRIKTRPAMSFSVDGEPISLDEATFEIIPAALRVTVGAEAELE